MTVMFCFGAAVGMCVMFLIMAAIAAGHMHKFEQAMVCNANNFLRMKHSAPRLFVVVAETGEHKGGMIEVNLPFIEPGSWN